MDPRAGSTCGGNTCHLDSFKLAASPSAGAEDLAGSDTRVGQKGQDISRSLLLAALIGPEGENVYLLERVGRLRRVPCGVAVVTVERGTCASRLVFQLLRLLQSSVGPRGANGGAYGIRTGIRNEKGDTQTRKCRSLNSGGSATGW